MEIQDEAFNKKINEAVDRRHLLPSAKENLLLWVNTKALPAWAHASIYELVSRELWEELNDRFFQDLAFGTGGMRSRTIGKAITEPEAGNAFKHSGVPCYAGVGSNMLNDFNVVRATLAVYAYSADYLKKRQTVPKLVIAYDMRYFSKHFAQLAAATWKELGGEVFLFPSPRSTPQLSFTVRYLNAVAGVMITASHNPSHDNGYKVYFEDGAQIIPPHAEGIIEAFKKVSLKEIPYYVALNFSLTQEEEQKARLIDAAYLECVQEVALDSSVFENKLKVVFTPLHGTGQVSSLPIMEAFGIEYTPVKEQLAMSPSFPSVSSPNPESPAAFEKGILLANEKGIDVVLATDPDADRMGVAVRDQKGTMQVLNGNTIAVLLAHYRLSLLHERGLLNPPNKAVLIKSFVTTPLLEAIAASYTVQTVNTLTGFKWIGAKLLKYEKLLHEALPHLVYDQLPLEQRRRLMLENSFYFVFGAEESYGFLATDRLRDKDANAAIVQFCELAAHLKERKVNFFDYLDNIYLQYGFFKEDLLSMYFEGASGMKHISNILESYRSGPPQFVGDLKVISLTDFSSGVIKDIEGDNIPAENFFFLTLENGYQYALRSSGTEPKIKFYLFGHEKVKNKAELSHVKQNTDNLLRNLKDNIKVDAKRRAFAHPSSP